MHHRSNQGFTLIEIIITLAITAIVGVFLATYLGPQIQIFHLNSEQSDARSACVGIINELQNKLAYGKDFVLEDKTLTYTYVNENSDHPNQTIVLDQLGQQLFPNLVRNSWAADITLDLNYNSGTFSSRYPAILLTVTVTNAEAEELYTLSQAVRCLNWSKTD